MKKKSSFSLWLTIIILAVIGVIIAYYYNDTFWSLLPSPLSSYLSPSPSGSPAPTARYTPRPSYAYTQAIRAFANRRIQFDNGCQAYPNYVTVKNGAMIMLDNRSATPRTFALDSKKYYVGGYGFKIVTLSSRILPHTTVIDCSAQQNVAQILIQK